MPLAVSPAGLSCGAFTEIHEENQSKYSSGISLEGPT